MKNIAVKDLGYVLPSSGQPFSFVPFIGKREKDIYTLISKSKGGVPNQVKATLSVLLDKVGQVAFPPYAGADNSVLEQRVKLFSSLNVSFGDAYYMYLCARREAFGDEVKMTLICPSCKENVAYTVDISNFNVLIAEKEDELTKKIDLVKPVTLNGKEYTKAIVSSPKFSAEALSMENLYDSQNLTIVMSTKIDGYDFPLSQEQVDEFPISVQRQLYLAIDSITAGISEQMVFLCPHCERTSPYFISWEYPSFFV